jgi:hypothetical protein
LPDPVYININKLCFQAILTFVIKEYVCLDGKTVTQTAKDLSKPHCFIVGRYDEHEMYLQNMKSDHLL